MQIADGIDAASSIVHSVSYCAFDKAVGNMIDFTFPPTVNLSEELVTDALQDYCFPDGAHDSVVDTVPMVLERAGGSDTDVLFGLACYHLKRDVNVHRGATQRSMLILLRKPLFSVCEAIVNDAVVPFFESISVEEKDSHREFATRLYKGLHGALMHEYGGEENARENGDVQPSGEACERRDEEPDPTLPSIDDDGPPQCSSTMTSAAPSLSPCDAASPPRMKDTYKDPHTLQNRNGFTENPGDDMEEDVALAGSIHERQQRHRRDEGLLSMHHPIDVLVHGVPEVIEAANGVKAPPAEENEDELRTAVSTTEIGGGPKVPETNAEPTPPQFRMADKVVECKAPLPNASGTNMLAYGASLKQLLKWFGEKATTLHWCLLCRIPILFLGDTAHDVAHAVRACGHLIRPIEVDVSRFAPYATIDHVDRFVGTVSASRFLAVGATNAYVQHKDFAGVVKADIRTGAITSFDGKEPDVPKRQQKAFDELLSALRDDSVRECYFRARIERFNRIILHQVSAQKSGYYYDHLCRRSNLIDVSLGTLDSDITVRKDTTDDFLIVDTEGAPSHNASMVSPPSSMLGNNSMANPFELSEEYQSSALERLQSAVILFEENAKKNVTIVADLHKWYRFMFKYFVVTVLVDSGVAQNQLFDELKGFNPKAGKADDDSLWSCGSDIVSALTFQQQIDRNARLRVAQEYRERVYLLIDSLCKHNTSALLRTSNRYFGDFFNIPSMRQYNMLNQVLLFSTTCTTTLYVNRITIKTSGTIYISKNYLCFEASRLSINKRHQIFPMDVISNVARDSSSVFGTAIKLMMDFPDGQAIMMTISNPATSSGLYELLHVLLQKQKRLTKLMAHVPPVHCIPDNVPIEKFACPRVIPKGLYTVAGQEVWDEVWENQRQYPVFGWRDKMLVSDPAHFSDFSGCHATPKDSVTLPDGFKWVGDWTLACYLDHMTTDKQLLSMATAEDDADETSPDEAATEQLSPHLAKKKEDVGYLYATHWTASKFRATWRVGNVVRRRLWIRKRALIVPDGMTHHHDGAPTDVNPYSFDMDAVLQQQKKEAAAKTTPVTKPKRGGSLVLSPPAAEGSSTDDEDIIASGGEKCVESSLAVEKN